MGLFFSRASTAEEASAGVDGHGLVAIITGIPYGSYGHAHRQKNTPPILRLRLSELSLWNYYGAGASSGIGLETARVMALRGVHIIIAVRNVSAGLAAKEDIVAKVPGARVNVLELDLSSMASVRRFAAEFESLNLPLNILM